MKRSAHIYHVVHRNLLIAFILTTGSFIAVSTIAGTRANAQVIDESASTIQGVGESIVELAPQKIRLLLRTKAEGSNAKEAIEALTKHKASVREELIALKANPDSIQFFSEELRRGIMGVPAQFQNSPKDLLPRIGRAGGGATFNIDDLPPVHTATCYVEAEWTLPSTDAEMLVYLPLTLRDEITTRDMLGDQNIRPMSPEQSALVDRFKAMLEERGSIVTSYIPSQLRERDDRVQIVYSARLDAEAKTRALKQAFDRARETCEELAKASGSQLGRLTSISRNTTPEDVAPSYSYSSVVNNGATETSDAVLTRRNRITHRDEISARSPDLLQTRFQVRAVFKLLKSE